MAQWHGFVPLAEVTSACIDHERSIWRYRYCSRGSCKVITRMCDSVSGFQGSHAENVQPRWLAVDLL